MATNGYRPYIEEIAKDPARGVQRNAPAVKESLSWWRRSCCRPCVRWAGSGEPIVEIVSQNGVMEFRSPLVGAPEPEQPATRSLVLLAVVGIAAGLFGFLLGVTTNRDEEPDPPDVVLAPVVPGVTTATTQGDDRTGASSTSVPALGATSGASSVPLVPSGATDPALPQDLGSLKFRLFTGEWPELRLEEWTTDGVKASAQLPWLASGLSADQSDELFAFTAPSATGQALYVGRNNMYVAISSDLAGGWSWHGSEPGEAVWIEETDNGAVIVFGRLQAEILGDRGEYLDVTADTWHIGGAQPDESIVGLTKFGIVLRSFGGSGRAKLVALDGEVVAEARSLLPLAISPDGYGLAVVRSEDQIQYVIIDEELNPVANLGRYDRTADWVEWSPSGEYVAFTHTAFQDRISDSEVHLEIWTRHGQPVLDAPIRAAVWDGAWTADESRVVVVASDAGPWLIADTSTGEIQARTVTEVTVAEIDASG